MTSPPKCQILDPPPPYVIVTHFFHYTSSQPTIRQIVTNFFRDQRP